MPFLLGVLILAFSACKQPVEEEIPPLSVKIMEFKATAGDCVDPETPCYEMHLQYPQVEGGPEDARPMINAALNDTILGSFAAFAPDENSPFNTMGEVASAIETMFNDFLTDFEDMHQKWFIRMTSETQLNHPMILSVSMQIESYTGGAHANHWKNIFNFDPVTGSAISWQDVISDPVAFLNLSEMAFRKTRDIPPSTNLEEAGFFFENGQFSLPENIGFTDAGILLIFNPYEAAAYALGATEFMVPWDELESLLKPHYSTLADHPS
jgi:hypothetical protein